MNNAEKKNTWKHEIEKFQEARLKKKMLESE